MGSLFDRLAIGQGMSERGFRGEALGKQHAVGNSLSLGNLFDGPIFVEKPGRGADDVFAHRFQQKVDRLAQAPFVDWPDGHRKCTRIFNDKSWPPFLVRTAFETRLPRIEGLAAWEQAPLAKPDREG